MKTAAVILGLLMICILAQAQTQAPPNPLSGTVSGTVQDQTGALIPNALIQVLTGNNTVTALTTTSSQGTFHVGIPASPKAKYHILIQVPGFQDTTTPVTQASANLHIVLKIAATNQEVAVTANNSATQLNTDPAQNQSANAVSHTDLDHLPVFDMDYISTLSRFLSEDTIGTNGTSLVVNGLEANGPGVSPSAIKSVRINQNPYSALFARPGRARIEIETEQGTPKFHGSASFLFRDSIFDASNSFAETKPPERRTYYEGDLTGPVSHLKNTSFLLSAEDDRDNTQTIVNAITLNGPVNLAVPTPEHHYFFSPRLFQDLGKGNQLWISYSYEHNTTQNGNVGGTTLPEAAINSLNWEHEVNVGYTRVVSPHLLNQLRFLLGTNQDPNYNLTNAPALIVQGAFTGGGAQFNYRRTESHFDGTDLVTYTRGHHEMKFGIDIPDISRRGFDDFRNFGGTYTFASLADYAADKPSAYSLQQGQGSLTFVEKTVAAFYEDTIRVTPSLSVALGLRYYWQNYFHNIPHNFAPRLSLAYAPGISNPLLKNTILRAGGGIFYDRTGPRAISELLHYDGRHLTSLIATNPSYPVTPEQIAALPPGTTVLDPRLVIPYLFNFSAGFERQVTAKSTFSATYIGLRGMRTFRSIDANAPLPPDFTTRPDPTHGQVREMQSEGYFKGNSLELTFRGKPVKWFSGQTQYTLGKLYNNTTGLPWFPAASYSPQADWGRSENDRRHKFDSLSTLHYRTLFDLGFALALYSNKPVNITTGNDDNHDGLSLDRPADTPRNSLKGPTYQSLDINLTHEFPFQKKKEESPKLALSLNAFNLLNHPNDLTYVGVITSPFFNKAVESNPPRRLQLNLDFKF